MGIYETYTKDKETVDPVTGVRTWTEHQNCHGWINSRTVAATPWVETSRTGCYCCSCPDGREGSDSACRNHGFAAERPCEVHNMPGSPWQDSDEMPRSVQLERADQNAIEAKYR